MIYSLTWLPAVLESAGLKVARVDGWESRGHGDVGEICGVICHHTAGAATGNMPSLRLLIEGRSDLSGPLAQLGLGRDGRTTSSLPVARITRARVPGAGYRTAIRTSSGSKLKTPDCPGTSGPTFRWTRIVTA